MEIMILYRSSMLNGKKDRKQKTIDVAIEELPVRPVPRYTTPRDRQKYIKTVESTIRKSKEYKEYIKFLKTNMDMNSCIVLKNIISKSGKRYKIELHHEPFTLFDIVETIINKRLELEQSISELKVADEVMGLHYDGKIGLIPLTVTMHELVHSGRIFIPLQYVYHNYGEFINEFQDYMNPTLKDKIEAKIDLSLHTENILSDSLDIEFVNLNIDGFSFPEIPEEWKNALSGDIEGNKDVK